jgi:hypothetical protein
VPNLIFMSASQQTSFEHTVIALEFVRNFALCAQLETQLSFCQSACLADICGTHNTNGFSMLPPRLFWAVAIKIHYSVAKVKNKLPPNVLSRNLSLRRKFLAGLFSFSVADSHCSLIKVSR